MPRNQLMDSSSPASSSQAPSGGHTAERGRRIGDFELLKKLGQGSMGAVYLARQVTLDRLVALKILPPEMAADKEFAERFRREARATARLNHPNVIAAYDVGIAQGYHYIAMEYVEGIDLEQKLKDKPNGRFTEKEVLQVARDMAQALESASAHGIVHRDIKPSNILVGSDGICKLTDLGLATNRATDQKRITETGLAVGTPYYISPEQARGETEVDVRSDIYSLGATLYHLVLGVVPFPGDNPVVIMTQHLTQEAKPVCEVDPAVSKALSRLIEKMMAKRQADRHQNAKDLLEDIEHVERGETPLLRRARAKAKSETSPNIEKPPSHPPAHPPTKAGLRSSAGPARSTAGQSHSKPLERKHTTGPQAPAGRSIWSSPIFWAIFVLSAVVVGLIISRMIPS